MYTGQNKFSLKIPALAQFKLNCGSNGLNDEIWCFSIPRFKL